jgi:hypothetical protein
MLLAFIDACFSRSEPSVAEPAESACCHDLQDLARARAFVDWALGLSSRERCLLQRLNPQFSLTYHHAWSVVFGG